MLSTIHPAASRPGAAAPKRKTSLGPRLALSASTLPEANLTPRHLLASGFHELLGAEPGDESLGLGFALSMAATAIRSPRNAVCFCSLASEAPERGVPYGHGIGSFGLDPDRLVMVNARHEKDLLWALEEAVASGAFGAVIGALGRQERHYAFPQSRRLKLRAAATQTPLYLLRHWTGGGATAAQARWRISARPSRSPASHAGYKLLGPPRFLLRLERMASIRPQHWEMEFDATGDFHMVSTMEDGPAGRAAKGRRRQAA